MNPEIVQANLFDEASLPEKTLPFPGRKCRHCCYYYKHQYYCSQFPQKGTAYGNRKVKGHSDACNFFSPIKK